MKGGDIIGRSSKSVEVTRKNLTKEEIETRRKTEQNLKGNNDKVKPFDYLSKKQKAIFKFLITEMDASGIIGNLDVYVLNSAAIAIDRLNELETKANNDPTLIYDDKFLKARKEYTNSFNKSCEQLCLSPSARAKMGTLKTNKTQNDNDPLLNALKVIKGGVK